MFENTEFEEISEEDIEILGDMERFDKVRTAINDEFSEFSEKEQIDYLMSVYEANSQIIKSLNLKTINENGEING